MEKRHGVLGFTGDIYGKGFTLQLTGIALLAMATSMAQFALTWYLSAVIDSIGKGLPAVLHAFAIIALAVVLYVVGNAVLGYVSGRFTSRFLLRLRSRLGHSLCHAQITPMQQIKDGDLLSIAANDVEGFRPWLSSLCTLGQIPVKMVVVCVSIALIHWKLFFLLLPVLPLAMVPSLLLSKRLHALTTAERESVAEATGFLAEIFSFMLVVKSYCLETLFGAKNRALLDRVEKTRLRRQLREQVIQTFGRCCGHLINPAIFILGGVFILRGEMTVGQVVTVLLLLNLVGEALNLVYAIPTGYQGANANMQRVRRILDLPQEWDTGAPMPIRGDGEPLFALQNLCFAYEQRPVLTNVTLSIRAGEKIAVVGMSGSGKSTLFKLLCGIIPRSSGSLEFLGQDLSALPPQAYREELSVVPQETFLFAGTVRENLLLARPGADNVEMIAACQKARIHGFIQALENGYDTGLGDMGTAMSKGQMQRIGLARAFLRDAPVWLFDEPTSALDPDTQEAVIEEILGESADRTVVMIAHGLRVPERFDRILLLHQGVVAGFDRHEVLLRESALYRGVLSQMDEQEEKAV